MTINSAEATSAMDFYVQLVVDAIAATPADLDATWAGEALGKGAAAMAIEGNWVMPYLAENYPGTNFAAVELPTGPQSRATLGFATCYAIAAQTTQLETARQLVAYLVASEQMASLTATVGSMPARVSLLDPWRQAHPEGEAFVAGLAYARMWSFGPRFNPLIATVNNGLGQAFLSVRAVSDILAEADGVGNSILARP
jgi:multiple sugar transport system substrate-binding protein